MSSIALTKKEPSKVLIIAAFAAVYIIWGSTYTAIIIAIKDIPPLFLAGSRFLIAGLLLYVFFRIRGESTPDLPTMGRISVGGFLMLFLGTGAVAWVEQYIPSGLAATIVATTPIWFVILDKKQWKFNFSNKGIIFGLIIGIVGVMTLFAGKDSFSFTNDKMKLISFFVLVFGTISWATGSLYSKYVKVNASTGMKAAIQMIAAGFASMLLGLVLGEQNEINFNNISGQSVWALVYLISMGSLVGFSAYAFLLSIRPPSIVGTYAYVNPVVAVFLGWLIAYETISSKQLIALAIILSGVILINLSGLKKQKV